MSEFEVGQHIATAAELDEMPPGTIITTPFPDLEGNVAERTSDERWLITGEQYLYSGADLIGLTECMFTVLRVGYADTEAPLMPEPCPYDFSHTRHWCGNLSCRAS